MSRFYLCLTFLLTFVGQTLTLPTPCDKLPRPQITIQELFSNQPYVTYWSSWPIFQCADVAYVLPQTGKSGFNLTNIVTTGLIAVHFNLILIDANIWNAILCSTGYMNDYPTVYKNFNGASKCLCVTSCDGASYKHMMCWGKTEADREELQKFVMDNEIPNIFDAQLNCDTTTEVCSAVDQGLKNLDTITTPKTIG